MKRSNLLHLKRSKVTNNVYKMSIYPNVLTCQAVARKRADGRSLQSSRSAKSKQPFSERRATPRRAVTSRRWTASASFFGVGSACFTYSFSAPGARERTPSRKQKVLIVSGVSFVIIAPLMVIAVLAIHMAKK